MVEDNPFDLTKPRGKQDWQREPHGIWYPRTAGICRPCGWSACLRPPSSRCVGRPPSRTSPSASRAASAAASPTTSTSSSRSCAAIASSPVTASAPRRSDPAQHRALGPRHRRLPVLNAVLAIWAWRSPSRNGEAAPFVAALGLFAISLFPYVVPHSVTLWEAAARPRPRRSCASAVPAADHPHLYGLIVLGVPRQGARGRRLPLTLIRRGRERGALPRSRLSIGRPTQFASARGSRSHHVRA